MLDLFHFLNDCENNHSVEVKLFFSIWFFFHKHSRITGLQGKGEGIPLTPHYHFHLLHRHLDVSWAITAESPLLHIVSNWTWTRNLWLLSGSGEPLNYVPLWEYYSNMTVIWLPRGSITVIRQWMKDESKNKNLIFQSRDVDPFADNTQQKEKIKKVKRKWKNTIRHFYKCCLYTIQSSFKH